MKWRLSICVLCSAASVFGQGSVIEPEAAPVPSSLARLARSKVEFEAPLDGAKLVHVEFDRRGERLLVATKRRVLVRNLETKTSWKLEIPGKDLVNASFAGREQITVATITQAALHRIGNGDPVSVLAAPGDFEVVGFAGCNAERRLAVTVFNGMVHPQGGSTIGLRQLQDGAQAKSLWIKSRWATRLQRMSPSGAFLALLADGGSTVLVNTQSAKVRERLDYYYAEPNGRGGRGGWGPTDFVFGREDRVLFIADSRGFVRAWDIPKRKELARWKASTKPGVDGLSLGPKQDILFSFHTDGTRSAWLVRDPAKPRKLTMPELPKGRLVFGASHRRFATLTKAKVTVWKIVRR